MPRCALVIQLSKLAKFAACHKTCRRPVAQARILGRTKARQTREHDSDPPVASLQDGMLMMQGLSQQGWLAATRHGCHTLQFLAAAWRMSLHA